MATRVVKLLGRGLGAHAYVYDLTGPDQFATLAHVTVDADEGWRAQWSQILESPAGRGFLHAVHRNQPRVSTLSAFMDRTGGEDPFVGEMMRRSGYADFISLNALDPSGVGVFVGLPDAQRVSLDESTAVRWARVGAHIAAALRLRRRLHERDPISGADAILAPDGRIENLDADDVDDVGREALRVAALAVENARSEASVVDDEALDLWQVLHSGLWTLVDHFEEGGRRYLVARRNVPNVKSPPQLTDRERQVIAYAAMGQTNKQIAYELGLAIPSVATYIARAMKKLGVESRVQLVTLLGTLGAANVP
jgi:DNA-binding CsgD family transcriptional regulator